MGRRPLASLNADYPMYQRHLGWTFGYFTEASSTKLEELVWRQEESKWGCADRAYEYPSMRPGEQPSADHPPLRNDACTQKPKHFFRGLPIDHL